MSNFNELIERVYKAFHPHSLDAVRQSYSELDEAWKNPGFQESARAFVESASPEHLQVATVALAFTGHQRKDPKAFDAALLCLSALSSRGHIKLTCWPLQVAASLVPRGREERFAAVALEVARAAEGDTYFWDRRYAAEAALVNAQSEDQRASALRYLPHHDGGRRQLAQRSGAAPRPMVLG